MWVGERFGTVLGMAGRPEARVKVVRVTARWVQIRRPIPGPKQWTEPERVDRDQILLDGGAGWEAAQFDPKSATFLSAAGEPSARVRVVRCYPSSVRLAFYLGEDVGRSEPETVPASSVRFDSGRGWGWNPPARNRSTQDAAEESASEESSPERTRDEPVPVLVLPPRRGLRVSYLRVSTAEQNEARQRDAVGPVDREFVEKASARSHAPREQLEQCLDYLRDGDTMVVSSMDRLARSVVDLKNIVARVTAKDASVHFVHENTTYSPGAQNPRADLMLSLLGAFAEFERAIIRERQREGIALAKAEGRYTGRKPSLSSAQMRTARARLDAGETVTAVATDLNVARSTLYRSLRRAKSVV